MRATPDERQLVDYLLGRLSEPERSRTEELLFTSDGLEEEMSATADDLIHDYLMNVLSDADRKSFETHFLALPRHRERLAFVRDLGTAIERSRPARREHTANPLSATASNRMMLAVAAGLVVLMAAVLLSLTRPTMTGRIASTPVDSRTPLTSPSLAPSALPASATPPPTAARAQPAIHLLRLPRETTVSVPISVPKGTRYLEIEVTVAQGPPSFDALIRTAEGREGWRIENLAPPTPGKPLVFRVPTEALPTDSYTLRIEGEPLRDAAPPVLEYRLLVVRER